MEPSSISIELMLPSENVDESVAFYRAIGFEIVATRHFRTGSQKSETEIIGS
ncbi:hypothetical protein SAMN05444162_0035 [Paenibacillaceae bacterium GAS479]|nr:hypothetical protein SAMN05444162_0035 [Paenibacillaceae bacterium GAS479]